jgi:aspartyl-tRNA(Asn)/glutamyl-tRNA(Gln) amidotransferase subunit A
LDISRFSAEELVEMIGSQDISCEDYIVSIFESIAKHDRNTHAYLALKEDQALEQARTIDKKARSKEKLGKLAGLGIAIKDNICTKGLATTCASKMLKDFIAPYDATIIERIKAEDAIILGKTNMDEFAMGNTTASSFFGPTFNPWMEGYSPGGSSGGSAVAVSAGMATLALGEDTGGSIRCPASFCSIVGLKPTYGLVSRYGLIAYGNSLEQIGPMTKRVSDCALLLGVIAGRDSKDSTSVDRERTNYEKNLNKDTRGLKVGVPKEFLEEGTSEDVRRTFWRAMEKFEEFGVRWEEITMPSLRYALATYYIIAMAEASSNLARYDGVRYGLSSGRIELDWNEAYSRVRSEGFGSEVKRRIMLGTFVLSAGYFEAYYLKAQRVRALLRRDFEHTLKSFDLIAGPTMPILPPKLGVKLTPLQEYRIDINTVPANLTGLPAISIPCGFVNGLPIGLQLMSSYFGEELLLRVANSYESATDHHRLSFSLR